MAGGWASLGLIPELVATVEQDYGWMLPTDIQDEAIPLILGGADVMASAETGSGKTAAFALPILQLCVETKNKSTRKMNRPEQSETDPGGGGEANDTIWRMSLLDRDRSIAIDPQSYGLRIQSRDSSNWAGCRANQGIRRNNNYQALCLAFGVKVLDEGGIVRVGWATVDASLQLGTDGQGWGYGSTGKRVHKGEYLSYPNKEEEVSYAQGDVIGCYLKLVPDVDNSEKSEGNRKKMDPVVAIISFSKNGKYLGEAFEIKKSVLGAAALYPAICLKNAECAFTFSNDEKMLPLDPNYQLLANANEGSVEINPRDTATSTKKSGPLAIIIEPTRDLAEQTFRVFEDLAKRIMNVTVRIVLLVGGINPRLATQQLQKNQVDILVGTPPIVSSYMNKSIIQPHKCRFFVLDEADQLIGTDSITHIQAIYGRLLPVVQERSRFDRLQVCFFSATLDSPQVRSLADTICYQPLWIKLRGQKDSILPEMVHHCVIRISPDAFRDGITLVKTDGVHRKGKLDEKISFSNLSKNESDSEKIKQLKMQAVLDVLEAFNMDQVLIFCRTNLDCDLMEAFLRTKSGGKGLVEKYCCRVLASMRSMDERKKSLDAFKNGDVRILLATDVAARGIDIRELLYVINMTLPDDSETYIHRVGRVGRAGRMGLAVSLVSTVKERVWWCRKGKKPPCEDTRDFEKGGNCIWHDEPALCSKVENILKTNKVDVTTLVYPDLTLPPKIKTVVETRGYGNFARENKVDPILEAKLTSMKEQVKDITLTESILQDEYWYLRRAADRGAKSLK